MRSFSRSWPDSQISPPKPRLAVLVACAVLLVGCGMIDRPATEVQSQATFQDRAAAVAKAWQSSGIQPAWTTGFVPLQELTVEPAWVPNGDLKASYGNGWIRSTAALPDAAGQGNIRFADGTSLQVPLVSAQTAYNRFPKRSGPCPKAHQPPTCQWLTITSARLARMKIQTTRGQAVVPAWRYTVDGLTQPLISVAPAPSAITSLPQVKLAAAPDGVVSAIDLISTRGDVVAFNIGIGACDEEPRGLVRETPDLVIVGGSVAKAAPGTSCPALLELHRVEVRTKQPVGTRPIVDALSGRLISTQPATPRH